MIKDMANKIPSITNFFSFKCSSCGCKNLKLIPIGVSYSTEVIDNSDIENPKLKTGYNKVKHISDVLADKDTNIVYACNECNTRESISNDIKKEDLRKYLKRNKLEKPMVLS